MFIALDTIMDYQPNKYCLLGCHISILIIIVDYHRLFYEVYRAFYQLWQFPTAAFVTSQNENTFGSWPVTNGLPTLEMHRHLSLITQIKHMLALQCH